MPDAPPAPVRDVRLVLPDDWWVVPLRPDAARHASVERLVRRRFAGLDDRPHLRAETTRLLREQADRAAQADARLLALSRQEAAGVPVPASLVVHWIDVPGGPVEADAAGSLLVAVEERLRPAGDPPPGFTLDLGRLRPGPVLRRVHEQAADLPDGDPVPSLVADYWLERPDGTGVVQLAFATPMVTVRPAMLELFDAVTGALRWVTGTTAS